MLVQGLGVTKEVHTRLEPVELAGNRATALALVFSELLQNALEHGGSAVCGWSSCGANGDVVLAIADDGTAPSGRARGHRAVDRARPRP